MKEEINSLVVAVWDTEAAEDCAALDWDLKQIPLAVGIIRWYRLSRKGGAGPFEVFPLCEHTSFDAYSLVWHLLNGPHHVHVTFNGNRFDVELLCAELEREGYPPDMVAGSREALLASSFDVMAEIGRVVGHPHPVSMDDLCEAHELTRWRPADRETFHHAEIPELWKAGSWHTVVTACRDDVQVLVRILKIGLSGRFLGVQRLRDTLDGEPCGDAEALRNPGMRDPRSPDEVDQGVLFNYLIPTHEWLSRLLEAAERGRSYRSST